jgi:16S rRNA (adenine1518-N6/adenine1519-N6)-dimethyltransferase
MPKKIKNWVLKQEQAVNVKLVPSAKDTLAVLGLKPKKSFGQNFMVDEGVNLILTEAARSCGLLMPIVEIGAGTGSLTKHLVQISPLVHAIERDRDLVPILRESFKSQIEAKKLVIHEADGARFDLAQLLSAQEPGVLVGNLPYHLTSSIIILTLKNRALLRGAVFLVQKEVATRLIAHPDSKDYGFLTAVLGLAFNIELVADVNKNAFWPVPKIDSAIIKLTPHDRGISLVSNIENLLSFVRSIFQKRRKKLSTILSRQISKAELKDLEIDPDLRPENLSPRQFLLLFNYTEEKCQKGQK